MESKLKSVDCVVEVHDARIPITGRNPRLAASFLAAKPYILVLNKADLIPVDYQPVIRSKLLEREEIKNIIFTNCKNDSCPGLKAVSLRQSLQRRCRSAFMPSLLSTGRQENSGACHKFASIQPPGCEKLLHDGYRRTERGQIIVHQCTERRAHEEATRLASWTGSRRHQECAPRNSRLQQSRSVSPRHARHYESEY